MLRDLVSRSQLRSPWHLNIKILDFTVISPLGSHTRSGVLTLLLAAAYILVMGIGRLEGTQRILSFLVLGTVLMAVSLVFTVIRARQRRSGSAGQNPDHAAPPG